MSQIILTQEIVPRRCQEKSTKYFWPFARRMGLINKVCVSSFVDAWGKLKIYLILLHRELNLVGEKQWDRGRRPCRWCRSRSWKGWPSEIKENPFFKLHQEILAFLLRSSWRRMMAIKKVSKSRVRRRQIRMTTLIAFDSLSVSTRSIQGNVQLESVSIVCVPKSWSGLKFTSSVGWVTTTASTYTSFFQF